MPGAGDSPINGDSIHPMMGIWVKWYKIIMALWGCYTKLHTANLYASLIQIISYTYTSMFNI